MLSQYTKTTSHNHEILIPIQTQKPENQNSPLLHKKLEKQVNRQFNGLGHNS